MEEITWLIYKLLIVAINKITNEAKRLLKEINWRRLIFSLLICFLFILAGWWLQNYLKIEINISIIEQFATIIASSLIALVALVGMMLIFGFETIERKRERLASRGVLDEGQRMNFEEGERLGRDLMSKFNIYNFVIATLNLFLLIFAFAIPDNLRLSFLFGDIALTGYSLYLITRIIDKVF